MFADSALSAILFAFVVTYVYADLSLPFERELRSNRITLSCRNTNGDNAMTPSFWLNSTDLTSWLSPSQYINRASEGEIEFTITQDLEGDYQCGLGGQISGVRQLLAYPQRDANLQLHYAGEVGVPLTIDCGVGPGKLSSYYHLQWRAETSNGQRIIRPTDSGFRLNLDDFSLTIISLDFSDAGRYHCDVTVMINPPSANAFFVPDVPGGFTVVAYRSARIETPPQQRTELLTANEERSTRFTCVATGDPRPTIQWKHNGEHVNMDADDGRFRITTEMNQDNVAVTSRLNVTRLLPTDSGRIECVTWNTVNSGGSQLNFTASITTTLSVIPASFEMQADITAEGNLQLLIILPAAIPEPMQLRVQYTTCDEERQISRDRLITQNFTGSREIRVEVLGSNVPFQEFKVQVALVTVVDRVESPYVPSTAEESECYDLSEPTIEDEHSGLSVTTIIFIAVSVIIAVGAIIGIGICGAALIKCLGHRLKDCGLCCLTNYYEGQARKAAKSDDLETRDYYQEAANETRRKIGSDGGEANTDEEGSEEQEELELASTGTPEGHEEEHVPQETHIDMEDTSANCNGESSQE